MTADEQARCLRVLERANSVGTAARTSVLGAFGSGRGYSADADYSPRAWLIHKTGVTKGAAVAYTAWVRRAEDHPRVLAALATGDLPESMARILCQWTNRLPEDQRDLADDKLVAAALAGMSLQDLAGLYGEIYEQSRSASPDEDNDEVFDDRAVRLITTFQGAGVMLGDLTPECAEPSPRCWMPWPPRPAPRTPAPGSSGTTTRSRRRWGGDPPDVHLTRS